MIKERVLKVQNLLNDNEAALISSIPNRFYLTGFETSDGFVVITKNYAVFLVDFRYIEKAKEIITSMEVKQLEKADKDILKVLNSQNVKSLYVEAEALSVTDFNGYKDAFSNITFSTENVIDKALKDMRAVKSEEELEYIKKAQELTDKTFDYILSKIKVGKTEKEIMLDMEFFMRSLGSEGVSFDFIVVSGKNSSLPHGVPTDKKIEDGDFLTMDFGAVVNGYRSDMTRTVAVGYVTNEQKEIYNTVLKAQTEAIKAVKAGECCKAVDKVARDIIYNAGYEGCFGHGLGHSVGIEIHEAPAFNTRCETILKEGTIMTVEPGIYIENKYGVRIEDMVYVTKDGCINLTKSPKELIIL